MSHTLNIDDFLTQTGNQARYFDLGRRIVEIPRERFQAFERAEEPYFQPFQQAAWLGIAFTAAGDGAPDTEPQIWFLRFPLDERGLLMPAARDDYLHRIIDSARRASAEGREDPADDNPFGFTPGEARMASFHARLGHTLGQPPSQHYTHALDYFAGGTGFAQWRFLGLQGIADVAVRQDEHAAVLAHAIPQLPAGPFGALCGCLENEAPGAELLGALAARLDAELREPAPDPLLVAAALRGLGNGRDRGAVIAAFGRALASPVGHHAEPLAAIAGRGWEALFDDTLRHTFLQRLARCEAGQQAFDSILADLLFLPILRTLLLADIHRPRQPAALEQAVSAFVDRFKTPAANGK